MRIQAVQDKPEIPDIAYVKVMLLKAVSFVWSHDTISSSDSKVRATLNVSMTDSGSERDKTLLVPSALAV